MDANAKERNLIKLVKAHPILYSKELARGAKNALEKDRTWKKICGTLNAPEHKTITRWKSLRDRFSREYRMLQNDQNAHTNWPLFEDLLFLAKHYKRGATSPVETALRERYKPKIRKRRRIGSMELNEDEVDQKELITTRRLIEAVREHDVIYDKQKIRDSKNLQLKCNAWRLISQKVGLMESTCYYRWRKLRDRFAREYRNHLLLAKPSSWIYFNDMLFLGPHYRKGKPLPGAIVHMENYYDEFYETLDEGSESENCDNCDMEELHQFQSSSPSQNFDPTEQQATEQAEAHNSLRTMHTHGSIILSPSNQKPRRSDCDNNINKQVIPNGTEREEAETEEEVTSYDAMQWTMPDCQQSELIPEIGTYYGDEKDYDEIIEEIVEDQDFIEMQIEPITDGDIDTDDGNDDDAYVIRLANVPENQTEFAILSTTNALNEHPAEVLNVEEEIQIETDCVTRYETEYETEHESAGACAYETEYELIMENASQVESDAEYLTNAYESTCIDIHISPAESEADEAESEADEAEIREIAQEPKLDIQVDDNEPKAIAVEYIDYPHFGLEIETINVSELQAVGKSCSGREIPVHVAEAGIDNTIKKLKTAVEEANAWIKSLEKQKAACKERSNISDEEFFAETETLISELDEESQEIVENKILHFLTTLEEEDEDANVDVVE